MAVTRNHKRGKTRGYILFSIAFFFISITAVSYVYFYLKSNIQSDSVLPVKAIEIEGSLKRLTKKEIVATAIPLIANKNIATLDLTPLHNELLQLPWVANVSVKKKMPDTVVVSIVEHMATAFWNDNGIYDAKSKTVFYPDMSNFKDPLVKLGANHDDLAHEVFEHAVIFLNKLKGTPYHIEAVFLDSVRSYRIKLQSGMWIILGRDVGNNNLLKRLDLFLESFSKTGFLQTDVEYIDLRYDVGFAIKKHDKK